MACGIGKGEIESRRVGCRSFCSPSITCSGYFGAACLGVVLGEISSSETRDNGDWNPTTGAHSGRTPGLDLFLDRRRRRGLYRSAAGSVGGLKWLISNRVGLVTSIDVVRLELDKKRKEIVVNLFDHK